LREVLATASGSTRSNAVAKTTRVDERKTVPTHPKNHSDRRPTRITCSMGLSKKKAAKRPG
jgi:hypothetical protein